MYARDAPALAPEFEAESGDSVEARILSPEDVAETGDLSVIELRRAAKHARRIERAERAALLRVSLEQTVEENQRLLNFVNSPDVVLLRQALVCRTLGSLCLGCPIPTIFLYVDELSGVSLANHRRVCNRINRLIGPRHQGLRCAMRSLAKSYASMGPQTRGAGNIIKRLDDAVALINSIINLEQLPILWHTSTRQWHATAQVTRLTDTEYQWRWGAVLSGRPPLDLQDALCLIDVEVAPIAIVDRPVAPVLWPSSPSPSLLPLPHPCPFDEAPERSELYGVLCRAVNRLMGLRHASGHTLVHHLNIAQMEADALLPPAEAQLAQQVGALIALGSDDSVLFPPIAPAAAFDPEILQIAAVEQGERDVLEQAEAEQAVEDELEAQLGGEPVRALAPPAVRRRPRIFDGEEESLARPMPPGSAALAPAPVMPPGSAGACPGPCVRMPRFGYSPGRLLTAILDFFNPPPPVVGGGLPVALAVLPAIPGPRALSVRPPDRPGVDPALIRGGMWVHEIQSPLAIPGVPHQALIAGGQHLPVRRVLEVREVAYLAELFPEFVIDYSPDHESPVALRNAVSEGLAMLANRPMRMHAWPTSITAADAPCYVLTAHFPGTLGITHDKYTYERGIDGFVHFSAEGVPARRIAAMDWLRYGGLDVRGGHLRAETIRWCPKTCLGLYEVTLQPGRAPPPPLHTDRSFYGKVEDQRFVTAVGTAMQQSPIGFVPRRWNPWRRAISLWSAGAWYYADNGSEVWHIPKKPLAQLRTALCNVVRDPECLARATNNAKSYLKTLPLTPDHIARMLPGLVAVAMSDVALEIDALRYIADNRNTLAEHQQLIRPVPQPPWWKQATPWVAAIAVCGLGWKLWPHLPKIVGLTFALPKLRFARGSMASALCGSWRACCRWARWPTWMGVKDIFIWPLAEATRRYQQSLRDRRREMHGLPPMSILPAAQALAPVYEEPIKRMLAWAIPVHPMLRRPLAGALFGVAEAGVTYLALREEDEYDNRTLRAVVASHWATVVMHTITACLPLLTAVAVHAAWNFWTTDPFQAAQGNFLSRLLFEWDQKLPWWMGNDRVPMFFGLFQAYQLGSKFAGPSRPGNALQDVTTIGLPHVVSAAARCHQWWRTPPPALSRDARVIFLTPLSEVARRTHPLIRTEGTLRERLIRQISAYFYGPASDEADMDMARWLHVCLPVVFAQTALSVVASLAVGTFTEVVAPMTGSLATLGRELATIWQETQDECAVAFNTTVDAAVADMPPLQAELTRIRMRQIFSLNVDKCVSLTSALYEEPFKKWLARKLEAGKVSNPYWTAGFLFGVGEMGLSMLGGMPFGEALGRHGFTILMHSVCTCLPLWAGIPIHMAFNALIGVSPWEAQELAQCQLAFGCAAATVYAIGACASTAPAASIVVGGAHALTQYCVLRDFGGYREPPRYSGQLCDYKEMKLPIPASPPCMPRLGAWLYGIGLKDHVPVCAGQCEHNVYCAVCHRFFQDTPHPDVRVFRRFREFYLQNACTLLGLEEFPELAEQMSYEDYAATYPGPRRRQLLCAAVRLCDDPFDNIVTLPTEEILAGRGTDVHPFIKALVTLLFVVSGTKTDEQVCGRAREPGHADFGGLAEHEAPHFAPRGLAAPRSHVQGDAVVADGGPDASMIFTKPRLILRSHDFLWQLISGTWIKPLEHRLLAQSRALFEAPDLLEALRERVFLGQRIFVTKGLTPEQRGALTVAIDALVQEETGEPTAEVDADGSNWDSTMKSHMRLLVVEVLRHYGVPEWFLQLLLRDTLKSRFRDNWGNFFEGPSAMCSGRTYTAYFHCLVNALITLFCAIWVHSGRAPPMAFVELTVRQVWDWYREGRVATARAPPIPLPLLIARVDGDDNKAVGPQSLIRKLEGPLYAQLHTALGVDMKFQFFSDTYNGDYCSSISWKCRLLGVETCVDGPIPGRAMEKCGYGLTYYGKEAKRNEWLRGVFEPCKRDWAHIPVLRAIAERCASVPGRVPKCPLGNNPRKLHVAVAAEADWRTWEQFEARYSLTREEVLPLEQAILAIPSLPALIRHPVLDRIMAVDFPDVR